MGSYTRETHDRIRALIREEVGAQLSSLREDVQSLREDLDALELKLKRSLKQAADETTAANNRQLVAVKTEMQVQISKGIAEQVMPKIKAISTYIDQKIVDEDIVTEWRKRVHAGDTGNTVNHRRITSGSGVHSAAPSNDVTFAFTDSGS